MRRSLCLMIGLMAGDAFAAQVKSLDFTIHQEYVSTRAMGMGNAFVAVADDHSAMFYNPAMLALRKDSQLRMFIRGSLNTETLDLMDEIKELDGLEEDDKIQAYSDLIVKHYGDNFHVRAPTIGAVYVRPKWGIAFIPADMSLDVGVHRQLGPMLNVNMYLDSTLAYSYSDKISVGRRHLLTWGATAKIIHRVYVGEALSAAALADGSDLFDTSHANEGAGADIDLGTYWRPPVPKKGFFKFLKVLRPSFGLVGRNLIDYGLKRNFHFIDPNSGEPPKLVRRFDFGTKFELPKFWVFDPKLAFDIRDMGHDNWTFKKGSHAGAELYWTMFNWWKGSWSVGLNQGYWTAGLGARLAWFQFEAVSYAEEVGTASVPMENRRYMLELALDF